MNATPTTDTRALAPPASAAPTALPAAPRPPLVRRRRRPALLGLGVALVAVGALLATWLAAGTGSRVAVLAIARPVERGEVIADADLTVAQVAPDPALRPIPGGNRPQVVGRHAATDLVPGGLLTRDQVTDAPVPARGMALVGVAVKATQMPEQTLRPGDRLLVVGTPPVDGDVGTDPPTTVTATVVRVGRIDDAGLRIVDVTVPAGASADLAARAATGRIALVLQPRGQ